MGGIRFRIARCDTLNDDKFIMIRNVCISVERDDNVGDQISHCIQLTGSQCIGKTTEESFILKFKEIHHERIGKLTEIVAITVLIDDEIAKAFLKYKS